MRHLAHFSLLTYHTTNLGDDIQSLAARQYLPQVDAYLDRDRLAEYRGPATTLIGNGWFCHDPQLAWPPVPQIRFLALSLHVHDWAKHQFAMHRDYWSPPRTPVGCRDEATQAFFAEQGVDAYFSACLTLTFPPADGPRRVICLVDLGDQINFPNSAPMKCPSAKTTSLARAPSFFPGSGAFT